MDKRPLTKRLGEAIAALLLWLVFTLMALPALLVFPLLVLRYVVTGRIEHRDRVKDIGKALDQFCNAAYFDGHPKETISSHAGRWLHEHGPHAPWWAHLVERLTHPFESNHVFKAIEEPFLGMPLRK